MAALKIEIQLPSGFDGNDISLLRNQVVTLAKNFGGGNITTSLDLGSRILYLDNMWKEESDGKTEC